MKDVKYSITYEDDNWKIVVSNIVSGMISGGIFLLLLFVFGWNVFIDIVLSAGSYLGLSLLLKPPKKIGNVSMESIVGGENLERQLLEAKKDFKSIQDSIGKIKDPAILQQAEKLNSVSAELIGYLENHPDKIVYARQFIDYYQDTAEKLLARYAELEHTGLKTADVLSLKENTENALESLHTAFEQQFQKLVQNEMTDMQAEIRLLEQTMKMEHIEK